MCAAVRRSQLAISSDYCYPREIRIPRYPSFLPHMQIALWSASNPLRRTRNLTISSFDYAEQSYAVLDLEFLEARFLVAANTTVLLKDVAVGRARKSSGQQLPFFAGESSL